MSNDSPVDEFMHLTKQKQELLFSGFIRENAIKSQGDILLKSAIFIVNKYAEFLPEIWDKQLKSQLIDIQSLSVIINTKTKMDREKSIYCIKKVSKGKHKWEFKYDKVTPGQWNLIGIAKTSKTLPTEKAFMGYSEGNGYAFAGPQQTTAEPRWKSYGTKCKSGDIVEMILDLDKRTLSYIINGKDYGIAEDQIEKTEYRAGVTLYKNDDKITLLSYQRL